IYLNQGATLLRMENIGKGGLTSTTVDVRLIMKRAIELSATAIVLCHNHPSGELKPSQQDIQLTQQIKKATEMLNISLLDHIIIHNDNCYSFLEDGILG
ncbi:MAG: JAB domain-containing protein, partial [Bacteroidales bacterium]|nr:JAB domain-containing protein [Bacteroidales bacterium]